MKVASLPLGDKDRLTSMVPSMFTVLPVGIVKSSDNLISCTEMCLPTTSARKSDPNNNRENRIISLMSFNILDLTSGRFYL